MTIENVYTVARDAVSRLARSEKGVFIRRHWEELLHEAFVRWLEIGTELENGEQGVRRYFMKAVIRQRQKAVRRENYFAKYKKYVQDRFRPYSLCSSTRTTPARCWPSFSTRCRRMTRTS